MYSVFISTPMYWTQNRFWFENRFWIESWPQELNLNCEIPKDSHSYSLHSVKCFDTDHVKAGKVESDTGVLKFLSGKNACVCVCVCVCLPCRLQLFPLIVLNFILLELWIYSINKKNSCLHHRNQSINRRDVGWCVFHSVRRCFHLKWSFIT